jgi:hypothetical protein
MKSHRPQNPSPPAVAALFLLIGVLLGCAYLSREGTIVVMKVNTLFSAKEIEIEINTPFLEKFKNRISITARGIPAGGRP